MECLILPLQLYQTSSDHCSYCEGQSNSHLFEIGWFIRNFIGDPSVEWSDEFLIENYEERDVEVGEGVSHGSSLFNKKRGHLHEEMQHTLYFFHLGDGAVAPWFVNVTLIWSSNHVFGCDDGCVIKKSV